MVEISKGITMKGAGNKVEGDTLEKETANDAFHLRFDLFVGDVGFMVDDAFVHAFESERLTNLLELGIPKDGIYRVDADPACFSSFLHLIRFGSLPQCKSNEEEMMLLAEADFWGVRPRIEKELVGHSSSSSCSPKSKCNKTMRESGDDIPCPRAFKNCHCPRHNVCHYYANTPPFLECFHCTYGPSLVAGYQGQNEDKCCCGAYYSHCRSCHKNYGSPHYDGNQYHKNECNCHGHVSKFHCNGEGLRGDCCDEKMYSCCHKTRRSNSIDNCCHEPAASSSTQNRHCCCCAKFVDSSCNEKVYPSCCHKTRSNSIDNCCHGPAATQNRHCCCAQFVDSSCQDIGFQLPYSTCDHRVESSGQGCGNPRCHCH